MICTSKRLNRRKTQPPPDVAYHQPIFEMRRVVGRLAVLGDGVDVEDVQPHDDGSRLDHVVHFSPAGASEPHRKGRRPPAEGLSGMRRSLNHCAVGVGMGAGASVPIQ